MKAWPSILVYYLCGVLAAAQLGKFAALAPRISQDLALGLAAMAALTSLLEVCGAVFGGVAGRLLPRLGLRRGLLLALACLGFVLLLTPLERPARPVLGLFIFVAGVAVLRGPHLHQSDIGTVTILGFGLCAACLGARAARDIKLLDALAAAWLAAALVSCVIALCQYYDVAGVFTPWMNESRTPGSFANLRQRNLFATLTSIGLVALAWFAGRGPLRRHVWWMLLLLALGNVSSASRTGMTQWLVLPVLALLWRSRLNVTSRRVLLWAPIPAYLAAFALLAVSGSGQLTAFSRMTQELQACVSRRTLWSNLIDLIADKPWLGWGWRELAWAHHMGNFTQRFCDIPDNAHNLALHFAVELGMPLAVIICAWLLWLPLRARFWRESDPQRQMAFAILAILLVHSMTEYPLWYAPFQFAFGAALGLLWPARASTNNTPAHPWPKPAQAFFALLLLAATGYANWDYHRVSQIYLAAAQRAAAYRENTQAKVSRSLLFSSTLDFARLTTTGLTRENAAELNALARQLLHYSPEPRVIELLIESAVMLGRDDEAAFHLQRYRIAYPDDYRRWKAAGGGPPAPGASGP